MNNLLPPFIALVISLGIFFGYVKPAWQGPITTVKTAISNNKSALDAAGEYKKRQNTLASELKAINADSLSKLNIFLPDSVDNVGLIMDISALMGRSGLSIGNIDVKDSSATTGSNSTAATKTGDLSSGVNKVKSIDLSLSMTGTYASLQAFLSGIEKSTRLLDIREIVVTGSDTGSYNYKIVIRLYWLN